MKVGNISFGARLTQSTFNFLETARIKGLDTEKMEDLMKEVYPDEFISTHMHKGKILEMEIVENPGVVEIGNTKKILGSDTILGKSYKINQNTIRLITEKLEKIKNRQKLFPRKMIRWELINKFGVPVPDNGGTPDSDGILFSAKEMGDYLN